MSSYLRSHGTRQTHQSESMRVDQVENSAGGFVWAVDKWTRLQRFLVLGSEGGSYYASEHELTTKNVTCLRECLAEDGPRFVKEVVAISEGGRAPSNDPALFALANAIALGDAVTKSAAAEALPRVARIGTHLYHFVTYAETMRGWGRTLRWAISNWYDRNPDQLAYQSIKYRQRDGWASRDTLRKAHPVITGAESRDVVGFISGNINHSLVADKELDRIFHKVEPWKVTEQTPPMIVGYLRASESKSAKETADLVREYNLPREALRTEHLNDVKVWEAMLEQKMPLGAMVRNLATMTRNGVLDSKEHLALVLDALGSQETIQKSRLHPMAILIGLSTYASGHGFRGGTSWNPKPAVTDALDEAFYLAFDNVEATGKSTLLAIDVSGSMDQGYVAGSQLRPREAAAAMALVTLHAEDDVEVVGFHSGPGGLDFGIAPRWTHYGIRNAITPIGLSRRQRLDDVVKTMASFEMGGTDCALPFLYAKERDKRYESFVVYTDSETWAGDIHPKQALDQYRQHSGIAAKSVVVGMVGNEFTIADPNDAGMLDVVGFDSAAPAVMADFFR